MAYMRLFNPVTFGLVLSYRLNIPRIPKILTDLQSPINWLPGRPTRGGSDTPNKLGVLMCNTLVQVPGRCFDL